MKALWELFAPDLASLDPDRGPKTQVLIELTWLMMAGIVQRPRMSQSESAVNWLRGVVFAARETGKLPPIPMRTHDFDHCNKKCKGC